MGIKKLNNIIKKYNKTSIFEIKITDLIGMDVAIDASLMIYKSLNAIRKAMNGDIISSNGKIVTHIYTMLLKLIAFKKLEINPIFIFDGKPDEIKNATIEMRKKIKEKYGIIGISHSEILDIKELIKLFGYNYIDANGEADLLCAKLNELGIVDCIISDDSDIIVFGGKYIIKNFSININKKFQLINIENLLNDLEITKKQLIDLSILFGTDYNKPIKIKGNKLELIKQYKNIDGLIKKKIINYNKEEYDNYEYIYNYFINENTKINKLNLHENKMKKNEIYNFLDINGLTTNKLINKLLVELFD